MAAIVRRNIYRVRKYKFIDFVKIQEICYKKILNSHDHNINLNVYLFYNQY
jgi:hypothetical protein